MTARTPHRPRWPRRVIALVVLGFGVYFAAGIFATLATERAVGYTGRSDPVRILLAATFGGSPDFPITSAPLAWATRICWAASIGLVIGAVVVHYRFLRRLTPDQLAARLADHRRRRG